MLLDADSKASVRSAPCDFCRPAAVGYPLNHFNKPQNKKSREEIFLFFSIHKGKAESFIQAVVVAPKSFPCLFAANELGEQKL